jgi:hypothetical protein
MMNYYRMSKLLQMIALQITDLLSPAKTSVTVNRKSV